MNVYSTVLSNKEQILTFPLNSASHYDLCADSFYHVDVQVAGLEQIKLFLYLLLHRVYMRSFESD